MWTRACSCPQSSPHSAPVSLCLSVDFRPGWSPPSPSFLVLCPQRASRAGSPRSWFMNSPLTPSPSFIPRIQKPDLNSWHMVFGLFIHLWTVCLGSDSICGVSPDPCFTGTKQRGRGCWPIQNLSHYSCDPPLWQQFSGVWAVGHRFSAGVKEGANSFSVCRGFEAGFLENGFEVLIRILFWRKVLTNPFGI